MTHLPINHSPEPIRLFKSDFLEFFTHITPVFVVILWLPVIVFFLARAVLSAVAEAFPARVPLGLLAGMFLWTLAEYSLHRWVFHFRPRTPWQERVVFLFHGIHHAQPQCKTRLVMPPAVSVPMAFVSYGILYGIAGPLLRIPQWIDPLFAGLVLGYLTYDLIHYGTHHSPMPGRALKYLKRHHMLHHFRTPDQRFGVSMPLWDVVFSTMPHEAAAR
jgi:dihydroceramide fatty acyl 2-hydroxylase